MPEKFFSRNATDLVDRASQLAVNIISPSFAHSLVEECESFLACDHVLSETRLELLSVKAFFINALQDVIG